MKSWKLGSPPHRRGKGIQADGAGAWAGITPAQAGKRSGLARSKYPGQDHPRMGGEKLMGRPRRSVGAGSPPRGRGKDREHNAEHL